MGIGALRALVAPNAGKSRVGAFVKVFINHPAGACRRVGEGAKPCWKPTQT